MTKANLDTTLAAAALAATVLKPENFGVLRVVETAKKGDIIVVAAKRQIQNCASDPI